MKKTALKPALILALLIIASFSASAAADELKVQNSLFVDIAIIDSTGKVFDANRWTLGTYNAKGIVYDQSFTHIGFLEHTEGIDEVKDIHYKVLARVTEEGEITDVEGNSMGKITETRVTDSDGRLLYRLSGPMVKRGLLVYLFFFTDSFGSK
jgi:hypothetical protein